MKKPIIQKRKEPFAQRVATRIWQEVPSQENPYVAESAYCHGYNLLDLVKEKSFIEMLHLLLTGELPTGEQRDLLDALFVALSNPGPRHPATRAAMNAGVARTQLPHILPVGLSILGGEHLGGGEVIRSMKWIREWRSENAKTIAEKCLQAIQSEPEDWHVAPGFGTRFGSRDKLTERVAETLLDLPAAGRSLEWCEQFVTALQAFDEDMGWLPTGLAAAAFLDLGLPPRAGAGLFQLACAPGLLAHGVEMSEGPSTGMPFIDEEHYIIE